MTDNDTNWMRVVRRLEAAYALDGSEALARMSGIEAYVLYEEKAVALEAAELMLGKQPNHERWALRRDCLKAEVSDIAAWIKLHVSPFNDPPPAPGTDGRERGLPAGPALAAKGDGGEKAAARRIRQSVAATSKPKEQTRQPDRGLER